MKPHLDIKHTGTLGTENRRRMTFDENSVAHLMSVLTDMYSDTELAPIREYSTNAWDAHRAAGVSDPIEITRPSSLNPIFIVKDHGIGMSEEDVLENFSRYGWSSKRDNDDEVGMLGLGCKSALTYTSQFTMIVTKDCIQVTVLVTRDPDGAGVVQIVDRQPSTDPNGVEVQIPVKHVHSFNGKITKFFHYWDRGTVLIDGEQPDPIWERSDALKLSDDVILFTGYRTNGQRDQVVMGNVAYPVDVPHRIVPKMENAYVVMRVPIGAVNFTPSREALHYTKRTETLLVEKRDFIMDTAMKKAQDDIDASPTHTEALRRTLKWREAHPYFDYTYKGVKVPLSWKHPKLSDDEDTNKNPYGQHILTWNPRSGIENNAGRTSQMRAEEVLNRVHVVGYEGKSLHRGVKLRTKLYFDQQKIEYSTVAFYPLPFIDQWLDDAKIVKYETIKAIDLPREQKAAPKRVGYRILRSDGSDRLIPYLPRNQSPHPLRGFRDYNPIHGPEEPGTPKNLVVLESGLYSTMDHRRLVAGLLSAADEAGENVCGVIVTKTEMKKFLAEHPTAVRMGAWLEKRIAAFYASITGLEVALHQGAYSSYGTSRSLWNRLSKISDLPFGKILDPDLRAAVAKFKTAREISTDLDLFKKIGLHLWDGNPAPRLPKLPDSNAGKEISDVLDRYPLLMTSGSVSSHGVKDAHFVEYINCVYTRKYRPETRKVALP